MFDSYNMQFFFKKCCSAIYTVVGRYSWIILWLLRKLV